FRGHAFLSETVGAEFLAFEHLDGEGDGVDLVVMGCVGEYADLFEELVYPIASYQDDFSFFGEVGPGEGPCEFVGGDAYSPKCAAEESLFTAELLNEGHSVKGLFQAVFGVSFFSDLLDDIATLLGELNSLSETIGYVEIACSFVQCTAEAGGVVGTGVGRDGKVVASTPSHVLRRAV